MHARRGKASTCMPGFYCPPPKATGQAESSRGAGGRRPQLLSGMAWGLPFLACPSTDTHSSRSGGNCPQLKDVVLWKAGRRLGHGAAMALQLPCNATICLQGDWRYQPAQGWQVSGQGSVGIQIRLLCLKEHCTGNFTGDAPAGLP